MSPIQEILVMLATATPERLDAAKAALLGSNIIADPLAGHLSTEAIAKSYGGIHRSTVYRRLKAAGVNASRHVGGEKFYPAADVAKAFMLQAQA